MENENKTTLIKKLIIFLISFIGILTTVKLAMIYYNANFNPYALSSFCSINEFIDCDGIAKTNESQFFGVPLALWGMFLYAFIFLMLFVDKLKNFKLLKFLEVFKNPLDYITALGLISFTISIILLCVSLFEIHKLCVLCAFTYILNLLIALVAADYGNGSFVKAFKQSVTDLLDALKIKPYAIAFFSVLAIAAGVLVYTSTSYVLTPQVKYSKQFKEFITAKTNKYAVSGNTLGDENADNIIYVYSDYRCPICKPHNIMMHKLAHELKGFKIVHRDIPLDTECNKYLRQPFHFGSCTMARYAIAAEKQGKFWDINTLFFDKQPADEAAILKIAEDLGLDTEKLKRDADSLAVRKQLEQEIDLATKKGINGTPVTEINGVIHVGIKPYDEFKKLFIEAGAKRR